MSRIYTCFIVDDEEIATSIIINHLKQVPQFEVTGVFHSAVDAFLALGQTEVDVLFLDIQMPKMTGISMLKMLNKQPLTVFTTAHREFALEGYDLDIVDYLLKPISLNRFLQAISRLKRLLDAAEKPTESEKAEKEFVLIKENRQFVKVELASIHFVEAIKNHIRIFTETGSHISLMPISEFEEKLPIDTFLRIHRSYIINLKQVVQFDANQVTLPSKNLAIGRSYKNRAKEVLISYMK